MLATWSKSGRTLTYDGRRRITRSKSGELMLAIDHAMTNDEGRYTLTLEPSDANAPKDLEPVVQVTRVIVNMKVRSRVGSVNHNHLSTVMQTHGFYGAI